MTTVVSVAHDVSPSVFSRIATLLDREALRNPDWNGVDFRLVRDDYTSIDGHVDESAGNRLLNSIQRIIDGSDE